MNISLILTNKCFTKRAYFPEGLLSREGLLFSIYGIYPFFQNSFKKFDTLDGQNNKARFGMSIACAGNINLDGRSSLNQKGIQDLVIGAPYDGPNHRGAIYIYLGTTEGISKKHAQVK